jgi:hypothetical protein
LPEGRFRLRAHGPRGESGEAEIDVEGGAASEDMVIALRRQA